ncbi:DUF427 domain-containing protein [Streptomyces sp. NPDC001904]|uniref:DUF427 domain-containing protein n=1 Tax=Streptomyces sp. NPDC001904 TaxID=3154531 RepID=UPI00332CEEA1
MYLDPLRADESSLSTATRENESVWDYPRPPAMRADGRRVRVECAGQIVADTCRAVRVLETSHPPVFYIPPADVRIDFLVPVSGRSTWCEWKGSAQYWDVVVGNDVRGRAAWSYPRPESDYAQLAGYFAFYPSLMDRCTVGGEVVMAQDGDFYGGWITGEVQGPFKGGPGTKMW